LKEKEFEKKVKQFLKERGCWVLKTWSNGVQRQGIPDLLVCCNGFFVGVELKAEKGRPSDLQLWNINEIRKAGGIAIVLYPDQFERFMDMICELQILSSYDTQRFYD
jgi:Holliday junction resolvase